jgi:hypothetical protein
MVKKMECPTCGWGVRIIKEYEEDGMVVGIYECRVGCPVEIRVASPIEFMRQLNKWE